MELPQIVTIRMDLGLKRTRCSCRDCAINCYFLPGYLVPADLARMAKGAELLKWAEEHLLASPGATVLVDMRRVQVPTLVPARKPSGSCIYVKFGKCTIHEDSPFGCAYFDDHMGDEEARRRSLLGIQAVAKDFNSGGDYSRVWNHLSKLGKCVPETPDETRRRLKISFYDPTWRPND